jgi:hypothetical protein
MVTRRTTPTFGTYPGSSKQPPYSLTPRFDPFPFSQHLNEVGVVELSIPFLMEAEDPGPHLWAELVVSRLPPPSMRQSLRPLGAVATQQTLGLAVADLHQIGSRNQSKMTTLDLLKHLNTLQFPLTQHYPLFHALPLLEGDILA